MFANSSQKRHWQFDLDGLASIRRKTAEKVLNKITDKEENELENLLEAQRMLEKFFCLKINAICKKQGYSENVIATSVVLFKRFFLLSSMAEFKPALFVAVVIFVAAKAEEAWLSTAVRGIDLEKLCNNLNIDVGDVVANEIVLLNRLNFELHVYHCSEFYDFLLSKLRHLEIEVDESRLAKSFSVIGASDLIFLYNPFDIASAIFHSEAGNANSPPLTALDVELKVDDRRKIIFQKINQIITDTQLPIEKKLGKKYMKTIGRLFSQLVRQEPPRKKIKREP